MLNHTGLARTPLARPLPQSSSRTRSRAALGRVAAGTVSAAVACALVAGCSGGGGSASSTGDAPAPAVTVMVTNMAYSPAEVAVHVGDTVTWKFRDNGIQHDVTSVDGDGRIPADPELDSGPQTSGEYSHTFTRPGTYSYICAIHPQMTGEVIVKGTAGREGTAGTAGPAD